MPVVNSANNQFTGGTQDLNGNMTTGLGMTVTYDERNRLASASPTSGGTEYFGYAPPIIAATTFQTIGLDLFIV